MDEAKARLLIQRIDASIEMLNQTKQDILDFLGNDSLAQIKELEAELLALGVKKSEIKKIRTDAKSEVSA